MRLGFTGTRDGMASREHDDLQKLVVIGEMAKESSDFLHKWRSGWFSAVMREMRAAHEWTSLETSALGNLIDAGMALGLKFGLVASLAAQLKRMEELATQDNDDITQTLGKALGYPWFKDDQVNFPGATEENGVCVGEHVAASIADEAAAEIVRLKARVTELEMKS